MTGGCGGAVGAAVHRAVALDVTLRADEMTIVRAPTLAIVRINRAVRPESARREWTALKQGQYEELHDG